MDERKPGGFPNVWPVMRRGSTLRLGTVPLLLLLLLPSLPAHASDPLAALQRLLAAPALRGARIGVVVADLESGQRLLERDPDRLMIPASNQKLLLASTALAHWGPAHRFETPVLVDGPIDSEGVLEGTLWLQGRGDPSLTSESLWKLAEEVRLHGIAQIRAGIGVDVSYFDGQHYHRDWEPLSRRAYHAPVSALAVNYSSLRIEVSPGPAPGQPVQVRVAPLTPYFRVRSEAVTVEAGGAIEIELDPLPEGRGERVLVRGALAKNASPRSFWRRVALPEIYAASLLRTQLESQGVRVQGPLRIGRLPGSARELLRFEGEPLGPIVWKLNKFSNNFMAEQLTKALGAELRGVPGSWEKGLEVIRSHVENLGTRATQPVLADGSGLSPRNRVSAALLVAVARNAALRFESGAEFVASLPLGGLDGTLEDRLSDPAPLVRGKTGHLRHVASLSGLLRRGSRRLVFAVLVNGARSPQSDVDAAIDAFVRELGRPAGTPEHAQGVRGGDSS
ncbi:MAG: D-alanyl-D-alanine carboxypeptidase/D-alanyl-D-alanine-endopeptidase [Myxococcota bacterium]